MKVTLKKFNRAENFEKHKSTDDGQNAKSCGYPDYPDIRTQNFRSVLSGYPDFLISVLSEYPDPDIQLSQHYELYISLYKPYI